MQIVRISWVSCGLFMPFRKSVRIFVRTVGESAEKMNFIPFRFETISLLHLSHFPQSILASFVHKKRAKHTHTQSGNIDFVDILAAVTVKLAVCLAFVRNPICAGWICFFSHSLQFWSKNAERKTVWFIGCGRQWTRHFSIGFAILFHSRNLLHFQ